MLAIDLSFGATPFAEDSITKNLQVNYVVTGDALYTNFDVRLVATDADSVDYELMIDTVPAPGSSGAQSFTFTKPITDLQFDYTLRVELDVNHDVAETDESNNSEVFLDGMFMADNGLILAQGKAGTATDTLSATINAGDLDVTFNGSSYSYPLTSVSGLHVRTREGDDTITLPRELDEPFWAWGHDGNDVITGGGGGNYIDGGKGADTISLFGGANASAANTLIGGNEGMIDGGEGEMEPAPDVADTFHVTQPEANEELPSVTVTGGGADTLEVHTAAASDQEVTLSDGQAKLGPAASPVTTITYSGLTDVAAIGTGSDTLFEIDVANVGHIPYTITGDGTGTNNRVLHRDVHLLRGRSVGVAENPNDNSLTDITYLGVTTVGNIQELFFEAGDWFDFFDVTEPATGTLPHITIDGGDGTSDLLQFTPNTAAHTIAVDNQKLSYTGQTIDYLNIEMIRVWGTSAGDTGFSVTKPATGPVMPASIRFFGNEAATNTLTIDYSAATGALTPTITASAVTIDVSTIQYYGPASIASIDIATGSGDDTFTLTQPATGDLPVVQLDALFGDNILIVDASASSADQTIAIDSTAIFVNGIRTGLAGFGDISVLTGAGDDTFTVTKPVEETIPDLDLDGGNGTNTLAIDYTAATTNQNLSVDGSQIVVGGSTIEYARFSDADVSLGSGADNYNIAGVLPLATLDLHAGLGGDWGTIFGTNANDVVEIDDNTVRVNGGALISLTFANDLTIDGGLGDDTVHGQNLLVDPSNLFNLRVADSAGFDTVDLGGNDLALLANYTPEVFHAERLILSSGALDTVPFYAGWSGVEQLDLRNNKLDLSDPSELSLLTGQIALEKLLLHGNVPDETPVGLVPDLLALQGMGLRVDLAPVGLELAEQYGDLAGIAKALHYLPLEIYDYVHNGYQFEAYFGYMKGSLGTIRTRAGNDFDLSQLLIELFTEANTSAQLSFLPYSDVAGSESGLRVTGQEALKWLGVESVDAADEILDTAYRQNGFEYFKATNVVTVDYPTPHTEFYLPHAWVTATVGGSSVVFDPSWKFQDLSPKVAQFLGDFATNSLAQLVLAGNTNEYTFAPGVDLNQNEYLQSGTTEPVHEWFENKAADWLAAYAQGYTLADFSNDGLIRQFTTESATSLTVASDRFWNGTGQPVGVSQVTPSSPLASDYAWKVDLTVSAWTLFASGGASSSMTANVFEISQSEISVWWPAAGRLALYFDGTEIMSASRGGAILGFINVGVLPPQWSGSAPNTVSQFLFPIPADVVSLVLDANSINHHLVADAQSRVNDDAVQILNAGGTSLSNEQAARVASLANRHYSRTFNQAADVLDNLFNTVRHRAGISVSFVRASTSISIHPELPIPIVPDILAFDMGYDLDLEAPVSGNTGLTYGATSIVGDASASQARFDMISATTASLESNVWQELVNNAAISTLTAFQDALDSGYSIDLYTSTNPPDHLLTDGFSTDLDFRTEVYDYVRDIIDNALGTVYVPYSTTLEGTFDGTALLANFPDGRQLWVIWDKVRGKSYGGAFTGIVPTYNAPPPLPNQSTIGGFVNIATGALINDVVDISQASTGIPLTYSRHYDSSLPGEIRYGTTETIISQGWYGNYSDRVTVPANITTDPITWTNNLGHQIIFDAVSGSTVYQQRVANLAPGIELFRVMSGSNVDKFVIRDVNGISREYDPLKGLLTAIRDLHDNRLELAYDVTDGVFLQFVFAINRDGAQTGQLTFHYYPYNMLAYIELDNTRRGDYFYTTPGVDGLLTAVAGPTDPVTNTAVEVQYSYYEGTEYDNTPVKNLMATTTTLARDFNLPPDHAVNRAGTAFLYYPNGRVHRIVRQDGPESETYEFDPHRRRTTLIDDRGAVTHFDFDTLGRQTRVTYPDRSFELEEWGGDPRGYDPLLQNLHISHTDTFGVKTIWLDFNTLGQFQTQWIANEAVLVDPNGGSAGWPLVTTYTYDTRRDTLNVLLFSRVDTIELPSGVLGRRFVDNVYDVYDPATNQFGDLLETKETLYNPLDLTTTILSTRYQYYANGLVELTIDARDGGVGNTNYTNYFYTDKGQVTDIARWVDDGPTFAHEHYEYDTRGFLVDYRDPREDDDPNSLEHTTTYTNDVLGRITKIEYPMVDGQTPTTIFEWDDRGNLTQTTETNTTGDQVTKYAYDRRNRLTATLFPDGSVTSTVYDTLGNAVATADALGNVTYVRYDERRRPQQVLYADGRTEVTRYNGAGQIVASTDFSGSTVFSYDNLGRLTEMQEPSPDGVALGRVWNYEYDVIGNRTADILVVAGDSRTTTYVYDSLNRLVQRIDPDPDPLDNSPMPQETPLSTYQYDNVGNLTQATLASVENPGIVVQQTVNQYDGLSRLTHQVDPDGSTWDYEYDLASNLTLLTDGRGIKTKSEYDFMNRLVVNTVDFDDVNANPFDSPVTTYEYDLVGNLTATEVTQLSAGPGDDVWRTEYEYDALNRVTSVTAFDVDGLTELSSATTVYDAAGNVAYVSDPRGYVTHYEYDSRNRNSKTTDPLGNAVLATYDLAGNVLTTTDERGNTTTYAYDNVYRLTTTTYPDPDGAFDPLAAPVETLQYDAETGDLVVSYFGTTSDPLQRRTDYEYDKLHRLVKIWEPDDGVNVRRVSESRFDVAGNLIWTKEFAGLITDFTYDGKNRLLTQTEADPDGAGSADGRRFVNIYDENGNLTDSILENLDATDVEYTKFEYDRANRQTTVKRIAVNAVQSYNIGDVFSTATATYDAAGNLTKSTDPLLNYVEYDVDGLGRVTTSKEFDSADQLLVQIDYGYDTASNLLSATNLFSASTLGSYTTADDRTSRFEYDPLNREVAATDPLGNRTTTRYDAAGNVAATTDPLDNETVYDYDNLNRRTKVTDAELRTTDTIYDELGNVTDVVDPMGLATHFDYNPLSELTAEKQYDNPFALLNTRSFRYDHALNQVVETKRDTIDLREIEYVYDQLGRQTLGNWWLNGDVEEVIEYHYRVDDQLASTNQRNTVAPIDFADNVDAIYTYDYSGDPLNRLYSVALEYSQDPNAPTPVSETLTQTLEYNERDELVQRDVSSSGIANPFSHHFTYDALGRTTSLGQGPAIDASPIGAQFSWSPADELAQLRRYDDFDVAIGAAAQTGPVVSTSDYVFDLAGRLTNLDHSADATPDFGYVYDAASRIVRQSESKPSPFGAGITEYTYDKTHQLKTANQVYTSPIQDYDYDYDDNGNRIGGDLDYSPQNRLIEDDAFTYTYDAEGNLETKTSKTEDYSEAYEWDFRNRLIKVTQTRDSQTTPVVTTIEYGYDMFDRRISKNVKLDGTPVTDGFAAYVYSGDQLLFVRGASGAISDVLLPGPTGQTLAQDHFDTGAPGDQDNAAWLLHDHERSVRYVLNSAQADALVQYNAFGEIVGANTPADAHSLLGYTGQVFDFETGLSYYNARYYDPATGRFLSEDPIGFAGGDANLYRYVGNNPVNAIDPTGEAWWQVALGALGLGGSISMGGGASLAALAAGPVGWFVGAGVAIGVGAYALFGDHGPDYEPAVEGGDSSSGGDSPPASAGGLPPGSAAANVALPVTKSSLAGPNPRTATLGGGHSQWNVDPNLMLFRINVTVPIGSIPVDSGGSAEGRGRGPIGEPGEVSVVGAILGGVGRGADNIAYGLAEIVLQGAAAAADLANAAAYEVSGHNLYYGNFSKVGVALASGQVTGIQLAKNIGLNAITLGGVGIGDTIGAYVVGDITADEFSQQIGGPAALGLAGRFVPKFSRTRARVPAAQPPFNPLHTLGAARAWTTRARVKAAQLPTTGKNRYIPPKTYSPGSPLLRGPNKGFLDKFGNEWLKGRSITPGQPFEWDVQLGAKATPGFRNLSRDGRHVNVTLDGRISH